MWPLNASKLLFLLNCSITWPREQEGRDVQSLVEHAENEQNERTSLSLVSLWSIKRRIRPGYLANHTRADVTVQIVICLNFSLVYQDIYYAAKRFQRTKSTTRYGLESTRIKVTDGTNLLSLTFISQIIFCHIQCYRSRSSIRKPSAHLMWQTRRISRFFRKVEKIRENCLDTLCGRKCRRKSSRRPFQATCWH